MKFSISITLGLLILTQFTLHGQPTMTENALPQIGQVIPAVFYEGSLEIGENGQDRVWNFPAPPTPETIFTN